MKIDDKFIEWAEKEIVGKYGRYKDSMQTRLEYDILMNFYAHQETSFTMCMQDIERLVMNHLPLTPVKDRKEDWEWDDERKIYIHKRMPNRLCKIEGAVINTGRFITCDISVAEKPEYRDADDHEIAIINALYPIQFPYHQTRDGILCVVRADKYIAFTKYKDECTGKFYNIFKYFDTSTEFWDEVPFSECSKFIVNAIGEE